MSPPLDLRAVLDRVEEQTLAAGLQSLRKGEAPPPGALGVCHGEGELPSLVMFPIIDLQRRFELLRAAIETSGVLGFVFMFDGFVDGLDGRHEALLVITATAAYSRARALVYWRSVDGIRTSDPVEAPNDIAQPYQQLFAPPTYRQSGPFTHPPSS